MEKGFSGLLLTAFAVACLSSCSVDPHTLDGEQRALANAAALQAPKASTKYAFIHEAGIGAWNGHARQSGPGHASVMRQAGDPSVQGFHFGDVELLSLGFAGEVNAIAVGDVTGDSRDDIVIATSGTGTPQFGFQYKVLVFRQSLSGTLLPYDETSYLGRWGNPDIELADMDGDGRKDVIVGHGQGISIIRYRLGKGFEAKLFDQGTECLHMGILDADRDGDLDVVCHDGGGWLAFYYGDGQGGIERTDTLVQSGSYGWQDLKVADVTGDGLDDILLFQEFNTTSALWVYPHKNSGGFAAPVQYPFPEDAYGDQSPWGMAIGDFNGDGRTDVAISSTIRQSWVGFSVVSYFDLMLQASNGTLGPRISHICDRAPGEMVSADFDGNGSDDLVVRYPGNHWLGYFPQEGGHLGSSVEVSSQQGGMSNNDIAAGDINGDFCPDLLIMDGYYLGIYKGIGCNQKKRITGGRGQISVVH